MIYLTSDLHFSHDKEFLYSPRGFNSVYEMNEKIVEKWNSIVSNEDEVYILGDLMLGDNSAIDLIKQLNGKLHVVIGNHDTDTRIRLYEDCSNIVEVSFGYRLVYKKFHFLLTHYPSLTGNFNDGKTLRQHTINLCGHSHTKDPFVDWDKGLIYHCELDAHNCAPVSIDKVIEDLRKKYVAEI